MANRSNGQLIIVDTASSTALLSSIANAPGPQMTVKGIRWVGATTAGHAAVITDSLGFELWRSVCSGPNYVESDLIERHWDRDALVTTLASGTLYIYLTTGLWAG